MFEKLAEKPEEFEIEQKERGGGGRTELMLLNSNWSVFVVIIYKTQQTLFKKFFIS